MIQRKTYIEALQSFVNKPQIKVITGIRRSGKSTVLLLLNGKLLEKGIQNEQIININFESFAYLELLTASSLYSYIKSKYVQVAYKLENQETVNKEFGNLLSINDQYPKYVVTMDDFWKDSIDGIRHFFISDFLLSDEF